MMKLFIREQHLGLGQISKRINLANLEGKNYVTLTPCRKLSLKIGNIKFSKKDSLDDSLASKSPTAIREELTFNVRDARNIGQGKNLMIMRRNT